MYEYIYMCVCINELMHNQEYFRYITFEGLWNVLWQVTWDNNNQHISLTITMIVGTIIIITIIVNNSNMRTSSTGHEKGKYKR